MIYHFRVISNEVDDFIFEIAIDSKTLFVDLHAYIQNELGFDSSQVTSFFITDEEWNKEIEVTLLDMIADSDHRVMDQVRLEELLTHNKQRLLYTFDILADRVLFMELTEIIKGTLKYPACLRKEGTPPPPFSEDNLISPIDEIEDEFNSFNIDEEDLDWDNDNQEDYFREDSEDNNYY